MTPYGAKSLSSIQQNLLRSNAVDRMQNMKSAIRSCVSAAVLMLLASSSAWSQKPSKQAAGTESIGDAVQAEDKVAGSQLSPEKTGAVTQSATPLRPIHILYVHGIGQVGAGDSLFLRNGICKYLGECTVTNLGRVYADGPFAVNSAPPTLAYMGARIWKSHDEWSASAPFVDRYEITGKGHAPILLDEFNWWPLAYPLKCEWLIANDSSLTGPSKTQLNFCATATTPDPAHPKRYLSYQWISATQASELSRASRRAMILNRSFKNGLMDWGFGDAVMALGEMEDVISAGIRELLIKSLQPPSTVKQTFDWGNVDAEDFFVTHSLGSYLSLVALDGDLLGPEDTDLPEFRITPEQKQAADYFSEHTVGFYFLANQLALLQLARVSTPARADAVSCSSAGQGTPAPPAIAHWRCKRELYLSQHTSSPHAPQIVAWSDPNDLLSWEVPAIEGVHVVNIRVHNAGFKIPPFMESPTGAHANYGKNREVLRLILKPSAKE